MAATASQTNLAGLPRRLVQDGIVSEDKLAEATELNRVHLYRMLSASGNPELRSLEALLDALGFRLAVTL